MNREVLRQLNLVSKKLAVPVKGLELFSRLFLCCRRQPGRSFFRGA